MREKCAQADALLARLAAGQHGVVASRQLLKVGIDADAVWRRLKKGRLHPIHQGVYAVGHPGVSQEGRWMAAVLACGAEAALSHASAAALWGLLRVRSGPIDVSTPRRSGRQRRPGIRLHRLVSLAPAELTQRRGIPVTKPARTVTDLRGAVPPEQLRRAIRQAELAGYPLAPDVPSDRTRSDLERDFLGLCRRHGIPSPEVNVKVGGWTVDFLWRAERVAVETDFYGYHRGRVAFLDDHARDLALRRHGLAVHRFSEEQIDDRPAEVAADLRHALALAS
jgi:hypothetical protein